MKNISVVIPTYNEEKRLPKTLAEVLGYLEKLNKGSEVIISDGGSTDKTLQEVAKLQKKSKVLIKVVKDKKREGKGEGVKKGILASSGQWVLFMDADNSTPISEFEKLYRHRSDFDIVIGSRYAGVEIQVKQSFVRRLVSRSGSFLIRVLTGLRFADTQCGFKLFSSKSAQKIFSRLKTKGWGFDVEVLLLAQKFGYKVKEVPVLWRDAKGSHLRAGRDGLNVLIEVIKLKRRMRKI